MESKEADSAQIEGTAGYEQVGSENNKSTRG